MTPKPPFFLSDRNDMERWAPVRSAEALERMADALEQIARIMEYEAGLQDKYNK